MGKKAYFPQNRHFGEIFSISGTFKHYFTKLNSDVSLVHEEITPIPVDMSTNTSNHFINDTISREEVSIAINNLKNNKSPGYDSLLNEYLKNSPITVIELLTEYFNLVLDTGIIPTIIMNYCTMPYRRHVE